MNFARELKVFAGLLVCFFIASCGYIKHPELRASCERDGGVSIYDTASNVEGIFWGGRWGVSPSSGPHKFTPEGCSGYGCTQIITKLGFQFVEFGIFEHEKPSFYKPTPASFLQQKFFRYTLEDAGDGKCLAYQEATGDYRMRADPKERVFPAGTEIARRFNGRAKCIGLEEIERPSARYAVFEKRTMDTFSGKTGAREPGIFLVRQWITDLSNWKTIAEARWYAYYGPSAYGSPTLAESRYWCPRRQEFADALVKRVLIPTNR